MKRSEAIRGVSVKGTKESEAPGCVECCTGAAAAVFVRAILRQPNERAGMFDCSTRRLRTLRRTKYAVPVRLEPTHALRGEICYVL